MEKLKSSRVYGNLTIDDVLLVSADATVTGNLTVLGTTTTVNSTTVTIEGPIVQQGAGANGASLTSDDGKDRGLDLSYYASGAQKEAFMGWNTANSEFRFGDNVTITGDVVTFNTYGNVRALHYIGQGDKLANITGSNVTGWVAQANYANYAGTVVNASQGNITSLGTLSGLTIDGGDLSVQNANIITSGSVTANGDLTIGVSGSNNSTANIYGNLNVTGKITGTIDATIGAKGNSWDVQYKDSTGNLAGSDAFKFDASSDNTVTIGTTIVLNGDNGNANIGQYLNMNGAGTNQINDASSEGVELYSTNYAQLNYDSNAWVWVDNQGAHLEAGGHTATLGTDANFTVPKAFQSSGGNLIVDNNGNVNAAGYGSFADVYITNASNTYVLYANGTQVYGDGTFTYDYGVTNTLTAGNLATYNANLSGNVTLSGHTAGNLLTTDMSGNIVDSNVSFSTGTLTVTNANVTANLKTANLQVTSFTTSGGIPIADAVGNLSTNIGLTYSSNTLNANNITSTGIIEGNRVIVDNLTSTQVVFANVGGGLVGNSSFTYDVSTSTLTANTINAAVSLKAANIYDTDLNLNSIIFADMGGLLTQNANFTFNPTSELFTAGNANINHNLETANLQVSGLNVSGGMVYTDVNGNLKNDSNLTYGTNILTLTGNLTSSNANITGTLIAGNANVTGNLTSTGILTDNLYYANGSAWDFAKANGLATYIQYKGASGDLEGNANFTFDKTGSGTLTVTGTGNIGTINSTDITATGNVTAQTKLHTPTVEATDGNDLTLTIKSTHTGGNVVLIADHANGGTVEVSGAKITGLAEPTLDNDAATKYYVDHVAQGLHVHGPAAVASTANIAGFSGGAFGSLSSPFILDGYTVQDMDRVLVKDQVTQSQNGIYVYDAGTNAMSRADDSNSAAEFAGGDFVFVVNGSTQGDTGWVQTEVVTTLGTDPIKFSQFSGAGSYTADENKGMHINGTVFSTKIDQYTPEDVGNSLPAVGTLDYDGSGKIKVADSAVFVTPNIGNATGDTLHLSGNIYANNANFSGVVFSNGNITLGGGSYLNGNVNGNISGNITVTGGAGAIQFSDSSNTLTSSSDLNFDSSNVTLTVGNGTTTGKVIANLLTGTLTTAAQPNVTSLGTLSSLSIDGGNLSIANNSSSNNGIKTDYIYKTDGTPWDFAAAAGSTGQIQFHGAGTDLDASANLTFDTSTNNLTVNGNIITGTGSGGNITGANEVHANAFFGDGGNLSNINGANVSEVALATHVTAADQGNITSVGTLASLSVTNDITSTSGTILAGNIGNSLTYLHGDGSNIANVSAEFVAAANLTGGTLSSNVTSSSLTSVGTLSNLSVGGNITVTTGNISTTTGNITSYGDIVSVTGDISANNANLSGGVVAANLKSNALTSTRVVFTGSSGNLTDSAGLTYNTSTTTLTANNITATSTANLGAIGNVTITGGTDGQYLVANGSSGGLKWASVDAAKISNGTSSVDIPVTNGNIQLTSGGNLIVEVTGTGANVTGYVTVDGDIQGNNITATANIIAEGTTDATDAITGTITTAGGISAQGNIYTGHAVGFANTPGSNTDSAAYIQFNSSANSLDFIFN